MKMNLRPLAALLLPLALLVIHGCENSFNPKTDFKAKLVVYAVLDKTADYQLVRLESTYDAELTNPHDFREKFVIDSASVQINDDRRNYILTDTLIAVPDTNGVMHLKKFWITRAIVPLPGHPYTLRASTRGYDPVTANLVYPSRPYLNVGSNTEGEGSGSIVVSADNPPIDGPKGFYFRMFLRAYRDVGGTPMLISKEIPYTTDKGVPVYSTPIRVNTLWFSRDLLVSEFQKNFQDPAIYDVHVFFKAYSLEVNMYNYFKTVRGFDDPVSVRQDKPDVTNVINGLGVFGAIASDSLKLAYRQVVSQQ